MIPRLAFVLVVILALMGVFRFCITLEHRGWSNAAITLVAALLFGLIAYVVLSIGPGL